MIALLCTLLLLCETTNGELFRMVRYKEIWKEALQKVPYEKLTDLKRALKKIDKHELSLKHSKNDGKDTRQAQALLEIDLNEILKQYGLKELKMKINLHSVKFNDNRIDDLWNYAKMKMLDEELRLLYREMRHLQTKVDLADDLSNKVKVHVDGSLKGVTQDELEAMRKKIQFEHGEHNTAINRIKEKVENSLEFKNKKVLELWKAASQRFNDEDLLLLKDELLHLQTRLDKLQYWVDAEAKHKSEGEVDDHKEFLNRKIKEHKKYTKKYHTTLVEKVYHTEL